MIKPEDFEFHFETHAKPDTHWQFAEAMFMPFAVPEANLCGGFYVVTRPKLGVCMSDISIMNRISPLWEDQLYIDNQQHLPCPKSFVDFSLPNGLTFKVIEPLKHYRATYEGYDDTRFELEYFGLHEPYDINDPNMDPMAAKRQSGGAWDSAWNGHLDATYRVKGELVVRGKRYKVDCVDTGDRSWGQRPERGNATMMWWNACFGEEFAAHVHTSHDIATTNELGPLITGYILENGKAYGIKEARGMQHYYRGTLVTGGEVEVVDIRNKKFAFSYSCVNSSFWTPVPSSTYTVSLMRVHHNGKIGYGGQQMIMSRAYLTRNHNAIVTRY